MSEIVLKFSVMNILLAKNEKKTKEFHTCHNYAMVNQ